MPLSPNLRGALFMALAMAAFTTNDSIVKMLSVELNMGQIIFIRGVIASSLLVLLAYHRGALRPLHTLWNRWVGLRVLGEVGGTLTFLVGLSHIPIANATAILQALPLAVTMGAALFLNEPVGWRRWSAIIVGFVGVMIIVRPGAEGFSPYSLIIVGTVIFASTRDISTRMIDPAMPALFLSSATAPAVALSGFLLGSPFTAWSPVSLPQFGYLLLTSGLIIAAYQAIIHAMRIGDISFIAPFRYTGFLHAILLGYLIFGDVPDIWMLVGGAIVIASGLYALYREHIRDDANEVAAESLPRPTP